MGTNHGVVMTQQLMDQVVRTDLYINGAIQSAAGELNIKDPANPMETVGVAAAASKGQALEAVAAAKAAFPAWSALDPAERARQLSEGIKALDAFQKEDAKVLSRENGKVLQEGLVDLIVFNIRVHLACGLANKVNQTSILPGPPTETVVEYKPLGVVTLIVPFNWPLAILAASLPYALVAGNTVVVKPPPSAPLATTRVVQRLAQQLPPGVLNVITGEDAEIGDALIANEDVAKVCFTGSVGGGKRIMEMASRTLTRVALELGGNDPALILPDAELDDAALDRLFHGTYDTTGQVCMAVKRLYVHRSRYQEVVDGLKSRLENTVLGRGTDGGTTMGPLHSPLQKSLVNEFVEEARASGAEVLEFGTLPEGDLVAGNFVRPSLVLNPEPELRIVTAEQFGPALPVMVFDETDDAVAAANDTWAGLCASVWTRDETKARSVAARLEAGYIFHNAHGPAWLDQRAPFGGLKSSGMGREMGIDGLREFMDTRSIGINTGGFEVH
jgi:acyl-CoA reductase-like NAD-dependent aldehyde dehydrogenase